MNSPLCGSSRPARWSRGEAFEVTAVRKLAEEAGLQARPESVLLLGTLCDSTRGFTRVTEIGRITDFIGEPTVREPELISRWEWGIPPSPCGMSPN
ncbi:NUDIX domain-containing protein [Streptomyces sp. NPDC096033]|uniref:NUDIX domain-containing protein n=1 Tax=Streptomyces sp. NPDC096033 TaxID=3366071 RepID=UPI0037F6D668